MIQAFSDGVGEPSLIHRAQSQLPNIQLGQHRGRVVQLIGLVIESQGPKAALGEICRLESASIPDLGFPTVQLYSGVPGQLL